MTNPKSRLPLLLLFCAVAALTVAAALMLFGTFMMYDDEGYVLISLRDFADHGKLYGDVYTQYGPFPFVFYYLLHLAGLPLTHLTERMVTLLIWSGSATLAAAMTWRFTRSCAAMLGVLAAVFVYIWVMVCEPGHPGGLILATTVILAALGCRWLAAGRWCAWAALAGAGCAMLLLTKINVGVFAALSAFSMLVLHSRNDRVRRWAPWVLAAGFATLPYLLTRALSDQPWVQTLSMVFAFSAVAAIGAAARGAAPECGRRLWFTATVAGGMVALIILGVIFIRGTTPAELLRGTILGPLRHPGHFNMVYHWPFGAAAFAAASFGTFLLATLGSRWPSRFPIDEVVAGLRLLAAAGVVLVLIGFPQFSPDKRLFAYSVSCLWPFLWPLAGASVPGTRAQAWLGLLLLGQSLHGYPVPGSQVAWGTVLALPLAAIGAWDAAAWLTQKYFAEWRGVRAVRLGLKLGVLALAGVTGMRLADIGWHNLDNRPLNLPGAEALRLPDATTALYRLLVFNAEAHGDMLFTLPGMFSLNLWSGLPTPTLTNVTHWFSLLDDTQQQAIIRALASHPKACIIVQTDHLRFLRDHQLGPSGPLYDYIMQEFEPVLEIDGFEFRVHRGRHVAPLLTGEVFEEKSSGTGIPAGKFNTLIRLYLLLPPDRQIGSVDIVGADDPGFPSLRLQSSNTRVGVTPIDLAGDARAQPQSRTFPFALHGPAMVELYFDRAGHTFPAVHVLLIVRDPAGAELALVRLRQ
jgi:hypothetical protein